MGRVGAARLYVPNATLQVLSRMVLMNFAGFVVFKIYNLVSMQNVLNANNCWHKQNLENYPTWPHIYFRYTFRISYYFCLIFSSLGCRLLVSHKMVFLENEAVCGSSRRAGPFVEQFIILSNKTLLNRGATY